MALNDDGTVTLPLSTVKNMLKSIYADVHNVDAIIDLTVSNLDQDNIGWIFKLLHQESAYVPLHKGDYVKFLPNPYDEGDKFHVDVLMDMGLYDNGYCYGKILKDTSWGKGFNPYHKEMVVQALWHDEDKKVKHEEVTCKTMMLQHVNKLDIPYFNLKRLMSRISPSLLESEIYNWTGNPEDFGPYMNKRYLFHDDDLDNCLNVDDAKKIILDKHVTSEI